MLINGVGCILRSVLHGLATWCGITIQCMRKGIIWLTRLMLKKL